MSFRRLALLTAVLTAFCPVLSAQRKNQDRDSLLTLISAQSASLLEENGQSLRKVIGPAKFLHNNTYLLCDTALWNVTTNVIYANGHVRIIQNRTVLSSETLEYVVDEDLAKFRGQLVQLEDKDKNTLRTRFLDYNTKDSLAVFQNGASMRDKDGQLIESRFGSYDAKAKTFTFMDNVNMFTDTIFIKTSRLEYRSESNTAYFGYGTDAWEHENMLSADDGWYDRDKELFFFRKKVHIQSKDYEGWSDSLYYHRELNDVQMLGRAEIMDTTRNVYALAGRLDYTDSLARIKMVRDPAILSISEENGKRDTLYFGADTLVYETIPRCDVNPKWVAEAEKRVTSVGTDAVSDYRKRMAEEAAKALEEAKARKEEQNKPPERKKPGESNGPEAGALPPESGNAGEEGAPGEEEGGPEDVQRPLPAGPPKAPTDTLKAPTDTLKVPSDSLKVPSDSLTVPQDTLKASSDTLKAPTDTLKAPTDSLTVQPDTLKKPSGTLKAASGSKKAPKDSPAAPSKPLQAPKDSLKAPSDTLKATADTLKAPSDTLKASADSLSASAADTGPKDSTKIGFLWAVNNVRLYRDDIQMACDSLAYTDLDSLVRMYRNPLVFNENGTRQYAADSLYVVVENQAVKRANLLSNAFIATQEDTLCYNQIRGTEVVAYFDPNRTLERFDALGDATALFYLEENGVIATVNRVECRMLYATFKKGVFDRVYYFESAKNDAYPIVQLPKDESMLKGFDWQPDKRPKGKEDVTSHTPRKSERLAYEARPKAQFPYTEDYFPGYIKKVHAEIAKRDALARQRQRERQQREAEQERLRKEMEAAAAADSLRNAADSLRAAADSLTAPTDSLGVPADSLRAPSDSLRPAGNRNDRPVPSPADTLTVAIDSLTAPKAVDPAVLKAQEKARKEAEKAARQEEKRQLREARWAESDKKYEERQEAKRQKALRKERNRKLKDLKKREKKAAKEKRRLEEYIERYTRQKNRAIRKDRPK